MASAPPLAHATSRDFRPWIIATLTLAYAAFIYLYGSPFAAGSDSSGYLNSARLLARGEFTAPIRTLPTLSRPDWDFYWQQPLGFTAEHDTPRMAPTYPTGLPVHLLLAAPIVGWEKAARLVNVLNVLAAAALLYALARHLGLNRDWALTAAAFLWACPLFIYNALQPLSDSLALTWAVAALLCAFKSRARWPWALAAGATFAVAVIVRPTNLLLALPLLLALGFSWRAWFACGLGGLPGVAWLAFYNFRAYGHALTTGYGYIGDAFAAKFLVGNLAHFALWVPLLVSLPVALAALALPWTKSPSLPPATLPVLGAWLGVFVAFYATYLCAGETWWYLRFLLPGFPAVILAGLLVVRARRPSPPWLLIAFCLAGQLFISRSLHITDVRNEERRYVLATRWLAAHVPTGSVVIVSQLSGAVQFYNEFVLVRTELLPADRLTTLHAAATAAGRQVYVALFLNETQEAFTRYLGGTWAPLGGNDDVKVWHLTSPLPPLTTPR
jgi:hypothetical protein